MSYFYATRTVQGPVTARGSDLFNAEGVKIGSLNNDWMATAAVMAINAGLPVLKEREDYHDYMDRLHTDAMLERLRKERGNA